MSILEHAYYSVISPEGCAGILWKTATETTKPLAAEALRLTSRDLARFGVIDDVIPEPLGGAHRDQREMATTLKTYLLRYLRELRHAPLESCWRRDTRSSGGWACSRSSRLSTASSRNGLTSSFRQGLPAPRSRFASVGGTGW